VQICACRVVRTSAALSVRLAVQLCVDKGAARLVRAGAAPDCASTLTLTHAQGEAVNPKNMSLFERLIGASKHYDPEADRRKRKDEGIQSAGNIEATKGTGEHFT